MVISKSTAVVHPRPCIKEAMLPVGHTPLLSCTLPRVRAAPRRGAELPSLRYGPAGASYSVSGPLRVARQTAHPPGQHTLPRKYTRSFTTAVGAGAGGGEVPTLRTSRRVRFDLPPPDDSCAPCNKSASRCHFLASTQPVQSVTVVCGTTSERQRAHPVATYVRGTLAPTAAPPGGGAPPPAALIKAAKDNDEDKLREMVKKGVRDVNAVDSSGRTAISYVASNGSVDILESMLQLPGIDPNLPDNEGNTPLHFAAQAGQVECLNFLLSRCQGLEIDARNHLGFTPLMKAALQGRNKCAKLLLFAGANPTLRDGGRGLRAEQWARYCGRYVCADVIEKFARPRLLERGTSCGRWGSDSDIGATRLVLGKALPLPPPAHQHQSQGANPTLRDGGRGLRAEQWARYCGRYVCADVIEKFARPRLLERGTSCGRWGSDSDIGATRLVLGKALPLPPAAHQHQSQGANPTLRDGGRGLRAEQWARYCGRYVCADVIEKFARPRLLERGTSCGRWGSDSDIGATRLVLGKALPLPPAAHQHQSQGIKSKLRKVFRTSSGPSNSSDTSSSARLVTQLTSAALCASSPVLPASTTVPPVVKSLIRPLTVPRLQITLANGAATVTSDLNSLSMLLEQDTIIEKPPRIKKKMK